MAPDTAIPDRLCSSSVLGQLELKLVIVLKCRNWNRRSHEAMGLVGKAYTEATPWKAQPVSKSRTRTEAALLLADSLSLNRKCLCRSSQHMMAATRLRSKENYGTSAEDLRSITKDHLVDPSGVTNTEATSTLVRQSLPQHSVEEAHKTAHFFARSHSKVGKHPHTAQLTVFYAGMVNVYDEVPLDKAEAIMVLAGRARTWASSDDTDVLSGSCATECGVPASIAMKQPVSRAASPSQLATKPECVPNVQRLKTIATKVELPQARKASLARFLERRKDRSRAGPYTSTMRSNCTAPNSSWLSLQTSSALSSPSRRI